MNSAVCTSITAGSTTFSYNFGGHYAPIPITFGQPYFYNVLHTTNNPFNFGPYVAEQKTIWENNSIDGDTAQPTPKRRRLSLQSDDSNTESLRSQEILSVHGSDSDNFIQHAFAPNSGQLLEPSSASLDTEKKLTGIFQYNVNMVREHPRKQRTAKEQERRDKNTIACRINRRKEKLKNFALEEQRKVYIQKNFEFTRESLKKATYLNELLKYGAMVRPNELNKQVIEKIAKKNALKFLENIPTEDPMQDLTKISKRPFSVAFLLT